ncbi:MULTISPECIES: thiosulfate oxidation carrier complex protein SoxZ [Methylosinus]|uniref:Thiosulfate oxidation carrier complex protein SoxZ n=1 Tax=Methylosinus trichosporium (strain ATCC 35070 / NCIMB 11131 / UNIQEM 75 / OB3b) TaxID=595536 RepID=A0A2D2D6M0_METT3|nr:MULTISPECIES: thiosulfate oxidation carrier complex protein SoxZ [Methylosinus]ATQ70594.1 thiosulfate oxidation carrier complex protein SoxZ [Methylosinus trichosporium OB3b]OBS51051.1 thiosulfate oxidation carrier complex protein SoxZ [Methylosinus sp. 3S-1]
MATEQPRVKLPKTAAKGEIIEIKTLIKHPMESGQRKDAAGNPIPRRIINRFTCEFNGRLLFEAKLETAISANPYLEFPAKVTEDGDFVFTWVDDDGVIATVTQHIALAG